MRRALFGAFLFLAACGGDVRGSAPAVNPGDDGRAERARFLLTAAAQQVISDIARTADQNALDSCLNAYVEDNSLESPSEGPISKPGVTQSKGAAQLKAFLLECLAGDVPHNLGAQEAEDMRAARTSSVR